MFAINEKGFYSDLICIEDLKEADSRVAFSNSKSMLHNGGSIQGHIGEVLFARFCREQRIKYELVGALTHDGTIGGLKVEIKTKEFKTNPNPSYEVSIFKYQQGFQTACLYAFLQLQYPLSKAERAGEPYKTDLLLQSRAHVLGFYDGTKGMDERWVLRLKGSLMFGSNVRARSDNYFTTVSKLDSVDSRLFSLRDFSASVSEITHTKDISMLEKLERLGFTDLLPSTYIGVSNNSYETLSCRVTAQKLVDLLTTKTLKLSKDQTSIEGGINSKRVASLQPRWKAALSGGKIDLDLKSDGTLVVLSGNHRLSALQANVEDKRCTENELRLVKCSIQIFNKLQGKDVLALKQGQNDTATSTWKVQVVDSKAAIATGLLAPLASKFFKNKKVTVKDTKRLDFAWRLGALLLSDARIDELLENDCFPSLTAQDVYAVKNLAFYKEFHACLETNLSEKFLKHKDVIFEKISPLIEAFLSVLDHPLHSRELKSVIKKQGVRQTLMSVCLSREVVPMDQPRRSKKLTTDAIIRSMSANWRYLEQANTSFSKDPGGVGTAMLSYIVPVKQTVANDIKNGRKA